MIALLVSYLLLSYLLVPRLIFRFVGAPFLPFKFQRTRTEEISFAVGIAFIPLVAAVYICGRPSASIVKLCEEIFAASYSEPMFGHDPDKFWRAIWIVWPRQMDFLAAYYSYVFGEACVFVFLIRQYGAWRKSCRLYEWFAQEVLLRGINEWYLLLTVANFPPIPKLKVVVDVLTAEDHLYQGEVAEYFVDSEGGLSGLYLENPVRFSRSEYLRTKADNASPDARSFWRELAGGSLYIPASKILNLNVRYPAIEPMPSGTAEVKQVIEELAKMGMKLGPETEHSADEPGEAKKPPE
jgi:hypothetical protein